MRRPKAPEAPPIATDPGGARPLTPAERELAANVFGNALDLDRIRVRRQSWWWLQPRQVMMAPDGHIWCGRRNASWTEDFARADLRPQAHFVHELTHVWQHQAGLVLPLVRPPLARYRYRLKAGKPFLAYGVEQQAEMVSHAFLLRAGAWASTSASLSELAALLPFSPWR